MQGPKQFERGYATQVVTWCVCERCGALVPRMTGQQRDRHERQALSLRLEGAARGRPAVRYIAHENRDAGI